MKKWIIIIAIAILLEVLHSFYKENKQLETAGSDAYEKDWRSIDNSEFIPIGKALIKNEIKGCGEYYVKQKLDESGEFLIACTQDQDLFQYYLV